MIDIKEKPFKTIDQQIEILEKRGLHIDDKEYARYFLITRNYYSMINDYGKFFTKSSDVYIENVTLKDIDNVYIFDKAIKSILYTHLLEVEKHLKSSLAYCFCANHQDTFSYLSVQSYKCDSSSDILLSTDVISRISKVIKDYNTDSKGPNAIKHYFKKYNGVPLWVVIQFMYFGDVIKMYKSCDNATQNEVAKVFSNFIRQNTEDKTAILTSGCLYKILCQEKEIRNCIAHNNKILNTNVNKSIPYISAIYDPLNIKSDCARADVYNSFIAMKCLISKTEYINLHNSIRKRIYHLSKSLNCISYKEIITSLGFPEDWLETNQKMQQ